MTDTQLRINAMHRGDTETILACVSAPTAILVLNAIMAGTKFQVTDVNFIKRVQAAEKSDEVLLGIPLRSFASAALHLLRKKQYTGDDPVIKEMIETRFGI